MNPSISPSLRHLNDCGCCEGLQTSVPVALYNRAGLAAVAYRIGTHARFKASLLARLTARAYGGLRPLRSREDDDFTIALLDAWAMVADVLTFYIERTVQESYLKTSTERLSVVELARLIGYRPHPGVAAGTDLVFTMDDIPGSPEKITIEAGTKVQSTPGQDEQAQIFETITAIEARPAWNVMQPRQTKPQLPTATTTGLSIEGIATGLVPGDAVLFTADGGDQIFAVVREVTLDTEQDITRVRLSALPTLAIHGSAAIDNDISVGLPSPAGNYLGKTMSAADLEAEAREHGFRIQDIFDALSVKVPALRQVLVFRQRAGIFGHNAPAWESLPEALKGDVPIYGTEGDNVVIEDIKKGPYKDDESVWPGGTSANLDTLNSDECPHGLAKTAADDFKLFTAIESPMVFGENLLGITPQPPDLPGDLTIGDDTEPARVFLDGVHPGAGPGSWIVLKDGAKWGIYQIQNAADLTKSCFTITAKVTRLNLESADQFKAFSIRGTTVYFQSELLPLARVPVWEPLPAADSQTLDLNVWVDGLQEGQRVLLSGREINGKDEAISEFITLDKIEHVLKREGGTRITFKPALQHQYQRDTVTLNANVAPATHGETVQEVLGSGDARQPYQQFALRQTPALTYTAADTPAGVQSTLEVRVNDILWQEAPTFYGRGPLERIFVTRTTSDGRTIVTFGDGRTGARLTSVMDNIRSVYRKDLGLDGLVDAGQLNILMSRPLGLKAVNNPHAATGADDPEPRDQARQNAPLGVLTLDRAVSLQDYEDFSRSFGGISKALATWAWDGNKRRIYITVAGPKGAAVASGGPLHTNLLKALQASGDPLAPFTVQSYRPVLFRLAAKIKVHADHITEKVITAVEAAWRSRFSFDSGQFGAAVVLSDVIAVAQDVAGVVAVKIDLLYRGDVPELQPGLAAEGPGMNTFGQMQAAELLMLHPGPLDHLEVMS